MYQKIIHIQFTGPYSEGFNYQENILPGFQKTKDNIVEMWATEYGWQGGELKKVPLCNKILDDGVRLIRFPFKFLGNDFITRKIRLVNGVYERLCAAKPDFIMVHDVQSATLLQIAKYMRENPETKLIVDCHADFSNSARTWLSRNVLHKCIYRYFAKKIEPYVHKFYGVLPARVDFLKDVYGLPSEKCELLVMGADDRLVDQAKNPEARKEMRKKYEIQPDDFLIMTGGKIDAFKTQTLLLMDAVKRINNPKVKLIVFGSVSDDLMPKVKELADGEKVQYIGWVQPNDSYKYFEMAELVVFPGRHSVFWEQVVGLGKPMLVKDWPGTHHVDLGGNVQFLTQDSVDEIYEQITNLLDHPDQYEVMKKVAVCKGMKNFSYKTIAKSCLER